MFAYLFELLGVHAASVAEHVSWSDQRTWLWVQFFCYAWGFSSNSRFLDFLLIERRLSFERRFILTFRTCFSDILSKILQDFHRKHEFINFLLWFHGIVFVIDTVEFKPTWTIDCCSFRDERNGERTVYPNGRKLF